MHGHACTHQRAVIVGERCCGRLRTGIPVLRAVIVAVAWASPTVRGAATLPASGFWWHTPEPSRPRSCMRAPELEQRRPPAATGRVRPGAAPPTCNSMHAPVWTCEAQHVQQGPRPRARAPRPWVTRPACTARAVHPKHPRSGAPEYSCTRSMTSPPGCVRFSLHSATALPSPQCGSPASLPLSSMHGAHAH